MTKRFSDIRSIVDTDHYYDECFARIYGEDTRRKPIGYITVTREQIAKVSTHVDPEVKATGEKRQALISSIDAVVLKVTENLLKIDKYLGQFRFPIPEYVAFRAKKKQKIDTICDSLNETFQKIKDKILETKATSAEITSFKDDLYNSVLLKHYRCYQLINKALEEWKRDEDLICIPEEGYLDALCEIVHLCRKTLSTGVSIERPNVLLDVALLNLLVTIRNALNRQAQNLIANDKLNWQIWMDACPRRWLRTGNTCKKRTRISHTLEEKEETKRKGKKVKPKSSKKKAQLLLCIDPTGKCQCMKRKEKQVDE